MDGDPLKLSPYFGIRVKTLLEQGLENAVQVGLRVGEERRVFVVVRVNDKGLRCGDEPEID
jgi:hypothetical protein